MILVDTSVWVDHFRRTEPALQTLLGNGLVVEHPFVTGELALGNLRDPRVVIGLLHGLPQAKVATEDELLTLIAREGLAGTGIGIVDAHLLASCRLTPGTSIWSRDRRLAARAQLMGISWQSA